VAFRRESSSSPGASNVMTWFEEAPARAGQIAATATRASEARKMWRSEIMSTRLGAGAGGERAGGCVSYPD
jgi:hypothetical protein